jgi:imidazolonepropionase-like amidohydrolase
VTRNAAAAIAAEERAGVLRPGASADLLVLNSDSEVDLAYHYGVNLTHEVVARGQRVYPQN